jgi:uncharacterized membrane protein
MITLGWFHMMAALLSLGTRSHRRLGWLYVGSMLALNGSALLIYRLFGGFGPFHVAALFSLATVVAGVVSAVRRRPEWVRRHYAWMTWSYVGLCAAAVSEVGTRTPIFPFWWAVLVGTAAVLGGGGVLIRRNAAAVLAPFLPRVRPAVPAAE